MKQHTEISNTQLWLLVLTRVAIGWHFLYEGLVKVFIGHWTSHDYLAMSRWWFAGFFRWISDTPWALAIADFINIYGLIAIGAGLMLGLCTRLALWSGLSLLAMYYVAYPPFIGLDYGVAAEGHYVIVNKTMIEMLTISLLLLFPTSHRLGLERLWIAWRQKRSLASDAPAKPVQEAASVEPRLDRRAWLKGMATLPFAGAFAYTVLRKKSYEEKHLLDAVTGASVKAFDLASLKDLKGVLPNAEIKGRSFSRLILGGNLLSGWAHSRDLIYVSQLVRAYHHKDKIFATLLLAEKCGINTLLTNPVIAKTINEYWDRGIGKIQFISDCVGLNYSAEGKPSAAPYQEFIDRIQMAIDHGACACYIQGETADYYMEHGDADALAKAFDLMQRNNVIAGIGAHRIETIQACVQAGFNPDFWMKTLHHHKYWSAGHPQWHDNMYCFKPEETISFMESLPQPFIAFKTLAAGAIKPEDGFHYAFANGADIVCAGIYDFQMVQDVNIAIDILNDKTVTEQRRRKWMA